MSNALTSKHYLPKSVKPKTQNRSNVWFYLYLALAVSLIVAGVGILFWLGEQSVNNQSVANQGSLRLGQPAPDFSLTALGGETMQLNDLKGQVVLVNLWATWCPPCKAEMPAINAFYQTHQKAGFTALMANAQEDEATVQHFIKTNGFTFPVLLDSQGELMKLYNVIGLPTTFIIDRNSLVQHIQTGPITPTELEAVVTPLLK